MTKFVKQVMLFVMLLITILISVVAILTFINGQLFEKYKYTLKDVNTILIGDSHMEMGMNDKLFPNSMNLAKSSDGYIHTYAKLKALLEKNTQFTTVILSYSAHNLSSYFHTFIDGRDARYGFADYFPILPSDEKYELLRRNKLLGIHALSLILKRGFNNLKADSNQYSFLGRYTPQIYRLQDTAGIGKRVRIQFYNQWGLLPFSDIQMNYLGKIIDLCATRNVTLMLVEMPLHPYYRQLIPASYKKKYEEIIRNKPVLLIECSQLQLPDSLFLPDGDHVNDKGADTTTKYIFNKLTSGDHLRK